MITLKVDPDNPDMKAIRAAADAIRRGKLVIFPTETVYGLAADAMNVDAVRKVFNAKGRADKQPLPVQIGSLGAMLGVVESVPDDAKALAQIFWPGPLTLVFRKGPALPDIVTAGGKTVGVRMSDHPVALALVKEVGSPIVATSANMSGGAAPRNAEQAIRDVGESVSVVLDSGQCRLGVSSTVVDVSITPARILRRGTIGVDEIRKVLGEVEE